MDELPASKPRVLEGKSDDDEADLSTGKKKPLTRLSKGISSTESRRLSLRVVPPASPRGTLEPWHLPGWAASPFWVAQEQAYAVECRTGEFQSFVDHLIRLMLLGERGAVTRTRFGTVEGVRKEIVLRAIFPPPMRPAGFMDRLISIVRTSGDVDKKRRARVAVAKRLRRAKLVLDWRAAYDRLETLSWGPAPSRELLSVADLRRRKGMPGYKEVEEEFSRQEPTSATGLQAWRRTKHEAQTRFRALHEKPKPGETFSGADVPLRDSVPQEAEPDRVMEALRFSSLGGEPIPSSWWGKRAEDVAHLPGGRDIGLRGPMWQDMLYLDGHHLYPRSSLSFRGFGHYLSDPFLHRLLTQPKVRPSLRRLALPNCPRVSADVLLPIIHSCPHLMFLDVTGCRGLTSRFFWGLLGRDRDGEKLRRVPPVLPSMTLEEFRCGKCPGVTRAFAEQWAKDAVRLRRWNLRDLECVTEAVADAIAARGQGCAPLESLDWSNGPHVTDEAVLSVTAHQSRLQFLSLAGCRSLTSLALEGFPSRYSVRERRLEDSRGLVWTEEDAPSSWRPWIEAMRIEREESAKRQQEALDREDDLVHSQHLGSRRKQDGAPAQGQLVRVGWGPEEKGVRESMFGDHPEQEDSLLGYDSMHASLERVMAKRGTSTTPPPVADSDSGSKAARPSSQGRTWLDRLGPAPFTVRLKRIERIPTSLTSIDLSRTRLGDRALQAVARHCGQLRSARLRKCPRVTSKGLAHLLRGCPALTALDLTDCVGITDKGLGEAVQACAPTEAQQLRQEMILSTAQMPNADEHDWQRPNAWTVPLRTLELRGCHRVSNDGIGHIVRRFGGTLEELSLDGLYRVTDVAMENIAKHCFGLTHLSLRGKLNLQPDQRKPEHMASTSGPMGSQYVTAFPRKVDAEGNFLAVSDSESESSEDPAVESEDGDSDGSGGDATMLPSSRRRQRRQVIRRSAGLMEEEEDAGTRLGRPNDSLRRRKPGRRRVQKHGQRTFFSMPRVTGRGLSMVMRSVALRTTLQSIDAGNLIQLGDDDLIQMLPVRQRTAGLDVGSDSSDSDSNISSENRSSRRGDPRPRVDNEALEEDPSHVRHGYFDLPDDELESVRSTPTEMSEDDPEALEALAGFEPLRPRDPSAIHTLNLRGWHLTDRGLAHLCRWLRRNTRPLPGQDRIPGTPRTRALVTPVKQPPVGLTSFSVARCREISDDGVLELAQSAPRLRELGLDECESLTEASIVGVAQTCTELRRLSMIGVLHLGDPAIEAIARHCPFFERMATERCVNLTQEALIQAAARLPRVWMGFGASLDAAVAKQRHNDDSPQASQTLWEVDEMIRSGGGESRGNRYSEDALTVSTGRATGQVTTRRPSSSLPADDNGDQPPIAHVPISRSPAQARRRAHFEDGTRAREIPPARLPKLPGRTQLPSHRESTAWIAEAEGDQKDRLHRTWSEGSQHRGPITSQRHGMSSSLAAKSSIVMLDPLTASPRASARPHSSSATQAPVGERLKSTLQDWGAWMASQSAQTGKARSGVTMSAEQTLARSRLGQESSPTAIRTPGASAQVWLWSRANHRLGTGEDPAEPGRIDPAVTDALQRSSADMGGRVAPSAPERLAITIRLGLRPTLPLIRQCVEARGKEQRSAFVLQRALRNYRIACMTYRARRNAHEAQLEVHFRAARKIQQLWRRELAVRKLEALRGANMLVLLTVPNLLAARLLQRVERGRQARKRTARLRWAYRLWRFHLWRRFLRRLNAVRQQRPHLVATELQTLWRSYAARQRIAQWHRAARVIQFCYRAVLSRRRADKFIGFLLYRMIAKEIAALGIQRLLRGYLYGRRVLVEKRQERERAAVRIQTAWRKHICRTRVFSSALALKGATRRIQAALRGAHVRRKLWEKWVTDWYIETPPIFFEQGNAQQRCLFQRPFVEAVLAVRRTARIACRRIVRSHRQRRFRRLLEERGFARLLREQRRQNSAAAIQRQWRVHKSREIIRATRTRLRRVRIVQALWRGKMARKFVTSLRTKVQHDELEAKRDLERNAQPGGWLSWYVDTRLHGTAFRVQRWVRLRWGPHWALRAWKREKDEAARVIQRFARARGWRRWMEFVRARKLQAAWTLSRWWRRKRAQWMWRSLMRQKAVLKHIQAIRERAVFRVTQMVEARKRKLLQDESFEAGKLQRKFRARNTNRHADVYNWRRRKLEALSSRKEIIAFLQSIEADELLLPFRTARVFLPLSRKGVRERMDKVLNRDLLATVWREFENGQLILFRSKGKKSVRPPGATGHPSEFTLTHETALQKGMHLLRQRWLEEDLTCEADARALVHFAGHKERRGAEAMHARATTAAGPERSHLLTKYLDDRRERVWLGGHRPGGLEDALARTARGRLDQVLQALHEHIPRIRGVPRRFGVEGWEFTRLTTRPDGRTLSEQDIEIRQQIRESAVRSAVGAFHLQQVQQERNDLQREKRQLQEEHAALEETKERLQKGIGELRIKTDSLSGDMGEAKDQRRREGDWRNRVLRAIGEFKADIRRECDAQHGVIERDAFMDRLKLVLQEAGLDTNV